MKKITFNKKKIINDPVYGFINIPNELFYDLIEHPFVQRLRRIKQLGMSNYVYPGANHTRFQHVLGAMFLMEHAIEVLRYKGADISDDEKKGALVAILLHDLGHAPFSHTLEYSLIEDVSHEDISLKMMNIINSEFDGELDTGIKIFRKKHSKKFLTQLVSSQLDMDRLDYLKRDSFFTGVSEGVIGSDRIIKMLNIHNNEIAVEAKGIYSIEKFLIARRLMYWQVYLHKTVLVTEIMLKAIMRRAKFLEANGHNLFASPQLKYFLKNKVTKNFANFDKTIEYYSLLDDYDIMNAIKVWIQDKDIILSNLCNRLINRNLFKIEMYNTKEESDMSKVDRIRKKVSEKMKISYEDASYFVDHGSVHNKAYSRNKDEKINILYGDKVKEISVASDISNLTALTKVVEKYFISYPKEYHL